MRVVLGVAVLLVANTARAEGPSIYDTLAEAAARDELAAPADTAPVVDVAPSPAPTAAGASTPEAAEAAEAPDRLDDEPGTMDDDVARADAALAATMKAPPLDPPVDPYAHGLPYNGWLEAGERLPDTGHGFLTPPTWRDRGLRYGTRELVGAISVAAGDVADAFPGATLYVGDLSYRDGGPSQWHRSHQNGLDVDLIFYAVDDEGRSAPAPVLMEERRFGRDLRAGGYRFDTARNWRLVRALVAGEVAPVAMIFVDAHLERALLEHARSIGEPEAIVQRAAAALRPCAARHDDHFHVRLVGGEDRGTRPVVAKKVKKGKGKAVAHKGKRTARPGHVAKKPGSGKVRTRTRGK